MTFKKKENKKRMEQPMSVNMSETARPDRRYSVRYTVHVSILTLNRTAAIADGPCPLPASEVG